MIRQLPLTGLTIRATYPIRSFQLVPTKKKVLYKSSTTSTLCRETALNLDPYSPVKEGVERTFPEPNCTSQKHPFPSQVNSRPSRIRLANHARSFVFGKMGDAGVSKRRQRGVPLRAAFGQWHVVGPRNGFSPNVAPLRPVSGEFYARTCGIDRYAREHAAFYRP